MLRTSPSVPVVAQVIPLNAGDVERTLAYWADDASVQLLGLAARAHKAYHGRQEVRSWLERLVDQHAQICLKIIQVRGDTVTTRAEFWSDLTRQLGIVPLAATGVFVVKEGMISSLTSTISPRAWLGFQCALQAGHGRGGDSVPEQ